MANPQAPRFLVDDHIHSVRCIVLLFPSLLILCVLASILALLSSLSLTLDLVAAGSLLGGSSNFIPCPKIFLFRFQAPFVHFESVLSLTALVWLQLEHSRGKSTTWRSCAAVVRFMSEPIGQKLYPY
jgi:hypothetical protein